MAEAAGLAIGALSLVGLFSSAIECMEYVDLARNYAQDYEIALVKFLLLKGRLNAWGESLQVFSEGNENVELRRHWDEVKDIIKNSLEAVSHIFGDVEKLQKGYGLRSTISESHSSDLSRFHQVATAFRSVAQTRQRNTPITKKAVWAVHDRKKFGSLLADLSDIIGSLEKLSERLGTYGSLAQLFGALIQKVSRPEGRELIVEASEPFGGRHSSTSQVLSLPPPPLTGQHPAMIDQPNSTGQDKAGQLTSSSLQNINGDLFINNHVKDQAKGFIGSVGDGGDMRHIHTHARFEHNTIEGQAKGGVGRFSDAAAASLWNS